MTLTHSVATTFWQVRRNTGTVLDLLVSYGSRKEEKDNYWVLWFCLFLRHVILTVQLPNLL